MTQEWIGNHQPVREPRSIMSQQMLETLSRELVRLCDSVEKHGLVDYQMGVAEEEVMDCKSRSSMHARAQSWRELFANTTSQCYCDALLSWTQKARLLQKPAQNHLPPPMSREADNHAAVTLPYLTNYYCGSGVLSGKTK